MRCAALCLAALLAAPTLAQDYSGLCATPANYQGGPAYHHQLTHAVTWDPAKASFTTSGSNLAGKDFSSAFSCPAEAYQVKFVVNVVAAECCGTGVSACWADYSHVCADPSSWTPSTVYLPDDGTTCDLSLIHI